MTSNQLTLTPLGGLKQIGSNMILLENGKKRALIDCGILFPNDQCYGINYLIPDFTKIDHVDQIFFTHGHEDHIGAVTHLLEIFPDIDIYAPPFAATLISNKLHFAEIKKKIYEYDSSSILSFTDIKIHPIQMNHSIPDTYGLLFVDKKNSHSLFYASDFKIDFNSPYEPPFELDRLKKLSKTCKNRILMADSTNILNPGKSPSEADVITDLEQLITNHDSRIFITLFASNIHRMQTIFNIAKKINIPVYSYGRSISSYIELAKKGDKIEPHNYDQEISNYSGGKSIVLLTGCQGEFRGALKRVATGENPYFTAGPDDLFIFSSKVIPGNEKSVSHILNLLAAAGSKVITDREKLIHVTGHPGQEDLKTIINSYNPTDYIPIHGETHFLQKQVSFLKNIYPKITTHFVTNFDQISIKTTGIEVDQGDELPPLLVHGDRLLIEREAIAERRKIATQGLIITVINNKTLHSELIFQGLPNYFTKNYLSDLDQIVRYRLSLLKNGNRESILEQIRVELRREANKILCYKPVVIVKEI